MKKLLIILSLVIQLVSAEDVRVYFGTGGEGIYSAVLNEESGDLSEPELVVEIPRPGFLALHNDVLYATTFKYQKEGGLAAFKISPDGGLSYLNSMPTGGAGNCHVSLDHTGKHVFFAHYSGASSGCIPLKADGSLSETRYLMPHEGSSVNESRQKAPHPHSIYAGPDNKFVYVPDLGTDEVWTFSFNEETGEMGLADKAPHPPGGGPRHMKFSKNGKQAYVLSELTLHTVIYDRDAETGKLSLRESVSNLADGKDKTKMSCSEIRISSDGRYAYVANRDLENKKRDSVSVFSIQEDGGLTLVQEAPAEIWIPRNITLSPSGKWLLAAGQKSDEISIFSVNQESGKLTFTGQKRSVPKAMCIAFYE